MKKQKSRFLTFVLSLMPGAGHMYMGFMQRGAAYMSLFLAIVMIATYLNISVLSFAAIVVWFYAFFESWNISGMNDEEFASLEDKPEIFGVMLENGSLIKNRKVKFLGGIALIVCGSIALVQTVFGNISSYLHDILGEAGYDFLRITPRLLVAALIIYIGIKLVSHNKEASILVGDDNAN